MMEKTHCGMVCRHHSGRVYTVLHVANCQNPSDRFPLIVVYQGANGNVWARPWSEFRQKFTPIFDGTNLAD